MALKGEAKTEYMREYMRRRRAKQATKPAATKPIEPATKQSLDEILARLAEVTAVLTGVTDRQVDLLTQVAQLNARAAGLEEERDRYKQMAESGGDQRLQARIAELEAALRQTDRRQEAERVAKAKARREARSAAARKRAVEKAK
jgi:hypothetical protein